MSGFDWRCLCAALLSAPRRTPFFADDGVGEEALVPAAVLFPIIDHALGPSVLLTQRTEALKHHPGQISFPGGRVEADDASPEAAALRDELHRLIGIDALLVIRVAIEGYSQAEAAAEFGLSHEAARKRYQRAMRRLRAALVEIEEEMESTISIAADPGLHYGDIAIDWEEKA